MTSTLNRGVGRPITVFLFHPSSFPFPPPMTSKATKRSIRNNSRSTEKSTKFGGQESVRNVSVDSPISEETVNASLVEFSANEETPLPATEKEADASPHKSANADYKPIELAMKPQPNIPAFLNKLYK
jgi:hypothetical protein